jgi:hypothetical protein
MKMNTKLVLALGAAVALATTPAMAKPGTDVLHFSIHTDLIDTGVEPGATGSVSGNEARQGAADNQKLDVTVSGLTADTAYSLNATSGSGTVDLLDFTTDANGKASLHLRGGKGGGKNSNPLPDGFVLAQVTSLDIVNGSAQSVLTTSGSTPSSVQYLVKRDISANGVTGLLQIKANTKSTKFTLNASGLDPDTDYTLFLNGTQDQVATSDSKGRLKIKSATTPDNILDLSSVELRDDSGSTTILSTTLP